MRVALYVPIKNELRILEFINYYILLGFDYFILFDDNSDIPLSDIIKNNNLDLNMFHIIKNIYYKNINNIYSGKHWSELIMPVLLKQNIDYLLHIDADEFLYSKNFFNIKDIINFYDPFDIVFIRWLVFGSNIKKNDSDSIINVITNSSNVLSNTGKSLVKVSALNINNNTHVCPHLIPCKGIKKNFDNKALIWDKYELGKTINKKDVDIYIAHYNFQDIETFTFRSLL